MPVYFLFLSEQLWHSVLIVLLVCGCCVVCPDPKLSAEENPCVSTSALCLCVRPCMCYRLKGGKRKMRHSGAVSTKWQK